MLLVVKNLADLAKSLTTRTGAYAGIDGGVFPLSFPSPSLSSHSLPSPSLSLLYPPLPLFFPSSPLPSPALRSRVPLNQLGSLGKRCKLPSGLPKTNLVHSRVVRKLLVAIVLSILKCMFYSRSIKV